MTPPQLVDWLEDYQALISQAALVELGPRTQIEISGADRAAWLHNLTTNEVRNLAPGAGCEAFLTSVQGKTLAHVLLFVGADAIVLDTVGGQAEVILKHLDHYLITERVTMVDRSDAWGEWYLGGPTSTELLTAATGAPPPTTRLHHAAVSLAGRTAWVRRVELAGPVGFLIVAGRDDFAAIGDALVAAGATRCRQAAFEAARIEWGFPLFGHDISDKNLPQEVARDGQAISFVKGCYLGQETVARIDALGHVNRTLVGVRFDSASVPTPGLELSSDGASAGTVTSASYSPHLQAPLALAYVRRGQNAAGQKLQSALGDADVVALPVR
ncbi:MAG: glycine cleavage T C-terminal barrel domain-containing protein [Pirellulales bacterium]